MKLNCTESGQRGAYGDSYYAFEITIEEGENPTTEEILAACQNGRRLPLEEWRKRQNEAKSFDERAGVYFRGWYTLRKTDKGYIYKGCNPYTD
jgi:hypothetical protein